MFTNQETSTATAKTTSLIEEDDEWGHHAEVPDASDLRQLANTHFANSDFDSALPLYTAALEAFENENQHTKDGGNGLGSAEGEGVGVGSAEGGDSYIDTKVIYLCNRATCLYRMEMYEESKVDAMEAVNASNGKNFKAIFRLAKAQIALKEYTAAITALEEALDNNNNNNNNMTKEEELSQSQQQSQQPSQKGRQELQTLLELAHAKHLQTKNLPNATSLSKLKTLKTYIPNYKPSIREFNTIKTLGEGNYSHVVAVQHVVTKEYFALKIIEKKKCEDLAKRQHPNVWNEIEMEKRILGERLWKDDDDDDGVVDDGSGKRKRKFSWCRRIVQLYHSFQDFSNLYFLESIHIDGTDLWSKIRYKEKMVGTHASLAKIHLYELLEALEFIHERGIVHRDLKAENILLSPLGHVILIDFGTSKDLIHTQYNGPEFVGTPDFMAPEAVNGESRPEEVEKAKKSGKGSDHTLDLWSFGALAFQLLVGTTPFWSPSQYMAYLRIQRGLLCRPMGITDDNAWDLITRLMKVNPNERLGADCFEYDTSEEGNFKMIKKSNNGYSSIRDHPYFADLSNTRTNNDELEEETRVFPSLRDLCVRAVANLVEIDSTNLNIDKEFPQGGGSSHDMLRMNNADRNSVMELLEKLRLLSNPRVYRRFFATKQEARLTKVRDDTRDFIGLAQMKDKQYQYPAASTNDNVDTERSDVLVTVFPILYMHVCNPLFIREINQTCSEEKRQGYIAQLKESLKDVNKTRPKLVVATGYLDDDCRRFLGKVNESIPVVLNDGSSFFTFWSCGGQGLVLRTSDFVGVNNADARTCPQMEWLNEQLEQSEMRRHHTYVFVDCEPSQLPTWLMRKLAKGRVQCMFGLSNRESPATETEFIYKKQAGIVSETDVTVDDDASLSSVDSQQEEEAREMKIITRGDSSVLCWKLEEGGDWEFENKKPSAQS